MYEGLKRQAGFNDNFLQINKNERDNLQKKQTEFKELLKKGEAISYMLLNFNTKNVETCIQIWVLLSHRNKYLEQVMLEQYKNSNFATDYYK